MRETLSSGHSNFLLSLIWRLAALRARLPAANE
jgi:hypothetical protein